MRTPVVRMAMQLAVMALVVGLPLAAWALTLGGPRPAVSDIVEVVSMRPAPSSWSVMLLGMGFLAVSSWHRWQLRQP
jgi:hypothetical protein